MIRIKAAVPRRLLALGLPTAWGATAITYKLACPLAQSDALGARVVTSAVFFAVGTGLILHVRQALLRELRQIRRVAGVAQRVLLRPLPPRIDGLNIAAAQLSADRGACVGGDLYEVIATEHGVRVVMGDVRGHGIAAVGTAAALLGSFREAVHDEPDLDRVLRRLERALDRHLRERSRDEHPAAEEFATVLLLEIRKDGEVWALNCGHPWPYLVSGTTVELLARADPLPPLGPFPLPHELPPVHAGRVLPGEALVLYTDGVEDARDARGQFFSLRAALVGAAHAQPNAPQLILRTVFRALMRHAGGTPADDIALLILRNDRTHPLGARGTARPATTHPQPTTHL
ncbi:magnesium or manganese-dependent protein phosphatase [Streptomyces davaonensis JCM 4913]|uniref:Magnesium or manganese-dependent protein phosphatase n=1 Tax=Streptomyces davaonensis (strain DSM 101723 / JCM 4913 / KCC S-0913 / 768) TaxID=1214101 RepID=K4RD52_STRDJ|nr:PP2C family protein-serine/threonine phosphatase [Streptomyces davaonensis]CCK31367.1 magnesium or manganese-dependent protein phosphatase [Streptomyces davaonensis JCM 4913]